MASFELCVSIDCPREAVFDFLIRPANIAKISPPDVSLTMVDVPEVLELSSIVEFEVGGFGPVQRMIHEITAFDRPNSFTETQRTGPLKSFVHEHIVEFSGSEAVVIDRITFDPPGGLLGFMVTEEFILKSLQGGFEHRHRELKRLLEQTAG
jgi:ligand-binding SRPBCC domain-containing protein